MEVLLYPNIAYLILAGGLVIAVLALLSPGTGVLEIAALLAIGFAAYAVFMVPINYWSLGVFLLGAALFILALRRPGKPAFLVMAIILIVLGSAFLFRSDYWWQPAVNPFLAAAVSILSGVFFYVAGRKVIEASSVRPTHDLSALLNATGEAKSEIYKEGSVLVAGELWSARSRTPIPEDARVRVVGRDGFILEVEALE